MRPPGEPMAAFAVLRTDHRGMRGEVEVMS
jgi:hypothetical protein